MLTIGVINTEEIHDILAINSSVIIGNSINGVFDIRARLCITTKAITIKLVVKSCGASLEKSKATIVFFKYIYYNAYNCL